MSLINKMLQDLEARQDTAPSPKKPVYQDLRPVRAAPRVNVAQVIGLLVAVAVALGAAVYFRADKVVLTREEAPAVSVPKDRRKAVPPVAGPHVAPAPTPESAPATTTAAAPASPPPPVEEPRPPVTQVPEPVQVNPALPAASAVVSAPEPPVRARSQTQSSRSEAALGIVKPAEPPSVAAVTRERRTAEGKAPKPKTESVPANSEESATLVDKKVRPLTAEESAEAGYRRAVRSLDQGRSDEALRLLREALAAQPTHIKARELAAGIELQNGHWREAEKLLGEGLRQVSNNYLFARMLARVYIDHGAEAKALAVMESAMPAGSDDAEFSALLGLLYQRGGRHVDAVKAYERAVALQPNDGRIWLGFAISLEGTEQWGAAKNAYRRAQEGELTPSLARYAEQRLAALKDR